MLTYDLSGRPGTLCSRLYESVKADISAGRLVPGEKLPSKRALARNLGVSAITVENAYDQLIAEGYMTSVTRKGYYVSETVAMKKRAKVLTTAAPRIHGPEQEKEYFFDFSSNHPDVATFPFSVWAKTMRETISHRENMLLKKSPSGGVLELRAAIARHLASFRAMTVDPDQIVIGAGTEYLYGLIVQLLGRDRVFCIETPGYRKLLKIYRSAGVACRCARMDDRGVLVEELRRSGADVAHITPAHHFPTGVTTPLSRRYEILAWANEAPGRYVVEDDYDSEFRVNGRPAPTLQSVDDEKVIYLNTFSKSLTSTIRISYMALPAELANRFYEELSFYSCTVSTFEQYALAAFINGGYFEKHINRMRLHYRRKRARALDAIRENIPEELGQVIENDSGLHFILKVTSHRSDEEIKARLEEQGIRIDAVSDFDMTGAVQSQGMFIVNYSSFDDAKLVPALAILRGVLQ